MSDRRFRGLFPILHTPFSEAGEVDFDSLTRLVSYVRECGADGVVFPGFASEFWHLSEAETLACATRVVEAASDLRVVLNVTAQATAPALIATREYRNMGAHALMMLPPFVMGATAAGMEAHPDAFLAAAELPCIVQDATGLTGTFLDAALLERLKRAHPNFAALKVDQVPTGPAISRYRAIAALNDLSYVVGYSGVQMLDAARRGGEGLMGGCGHLREDRRMVDALLSADERKGYREFARLVPLLNFEMQTLELAVSVHKRLLYEARVIASPLMRAPCRPMDETHAGELQLHMSALREGGLDL